MGTWRDDQRQEIISGIIDKGGLYGHFIKFIMNEPEKCDQFIIECFEQCHHKEQWDHWGVDLTLKVISYRLALIRTDLETTTT